MAAVSLAELFERFFSVERAAEGMLRRLAERLAGRGDLARMVLGLAADKRDYLEMMGRFRDSLPPALLASPADETAARLVGRVAALLEDDPVGGFSDFDEAYEFIQELENNELLPLLRLLEGECRTERIDCSAINLVVEGHLSRLEAVAAAAGDRLQRRAIRL